jgi:hypothetical protein
VTTPHGKFFFSFAGMVVFASGIKRDMLFPFVLQTKKSLNNSGTRLPFYIVKMSELFRWEDY